MWLRRPLGIAIELLAGIPRIIYGIWGLFVFAPFLQDTSSPALIEHVRERAGAIGALRRAALRHRHSHRRPDPGDHGPAVHRLDHRATCSTPCRRCSRKSAYGLGCTTVGGVALRRAALYPDRRGRRRDARPRPRARRDHGGDLRDRQRPQDLRLAAAAGTTISASIANEFTEAVGELYTSSLIALGLILFVITFIVLAAARLHAHAPREGAG